MFPFFEPISGFRIYSFGLTITICFFLFLWMLKKLSKKFNFDYSIFTKNILWYFLPIFLFSRLFYVIGKWNELKFIDNFLEFFIMNDYNFSLFGAIVGFFSILFVNIRLRHEKLEKYIDGIVISFIFTLFIGYIGAFLGGQVYGKYTTFGIELLYNHPFTPVPFSIPIFPLAIVYSILFFILFSVLYILSMYVKIKGLLGYIGLIIFSSIILSLEFFSGKDDILKNVININLSQFFSILIIILIIPRIYNIYKKER